MDYAQLFETLGVDIETALSIGMSVFGVVALLRSEIKGDLLKGWRSRAVGGVLALLLAIKAVPMMEGATLETYYTMLVTGLAGWGIAMLPQKFTKGTALEIKRNGKQ